MKWSRGTRRVFLVLTAVLFAAMTVVLVSDISLARNPRRPEDTRALAQWLTHHPADWIGASALSDSVLDSNLQRRFEIWRAAHDVAHELAPLRPNATAAFVRGGLFHWYELSPADRKAVLDAAAPLLRDEGVFGDLHRPLWQLTRDFAYLRRNAPDTLNALDQLRRLAAFAGLFAEYREAREAMQRKQQQIFEQRRATLSVEEMVLLARDPVAADEPLLRGILEELQRRSFEPSQLVGLEPLILYALEHKLQPLDGAAPLVHREEALSAATRARLALAINDPTTAKGIEVSSAITGTREWRSYRVDRAAYEASTGNLGATLAQINHALLPKPTVFGLAGAERAMSILGDANAAASYRNQLLALQGIEWQNACSGGELCDVVTTHVYVTNGVLPLTFSASQTDETAPYLEIYVDDALAAEGEVAETRTFNIRAANGLHRVEVRMINPLMRNGTQRRVRLS